VFFSFFLLAIDDSENVGESFQGRSWVAVTVTVKVKGGRGARGKLFLFFLFLFLFFHSKTLLVQLTHSHTPSLKNFWTVKDPM